MSSGSGARCHPRALCHPRRAALAPRRRRGAELHAPGKGQSNRREIGLDRFFVHGPPVPPSPVMRVDDPIPCARVYGRGGTAFLASTFRSRLAGCVLIATAKLAPSRSRSLRFVSGPPSEE